MYGPEGIYTRARIKSPHRPAYQTAGPKNGNFDSSFASREGVIMAQFPLELLWHGFRQIAS